MDKNSKILVTGGSGFIGSHMVDRLINEGYTQVSSIDNYMGSIREVNYTNPKCTYYYIDIADFRVLDKFFNDSKFDYVFHFAANGNVPLSNDYPSIDFNSNALGSFNVLNCCVKYNIKKVLYSSTAAVYGDPKFDQTQEVHELKPISNYGCTKLYGEILGNAYWKTYGLNFVTIRIFNTYGPRQPRYVLFDLIRKLNINSSELEVLGTGEQIRDYSYISDTVNAFYLAFLKEDNAGEVYNISGGNPITIKQLVAYICEVLGINPKVTYTGKSWKGDIKVLSGSIDKIKKELGFTPQFNIQKGLKESIDWFKANNLIK